MFSLRYYAQCIGLTDNLSILHDFFGYSTFPVNLSLRAHIEKLAWPRIDINIIRVGVDQMTSSDIAEIDLAIYGTRSIYAQVQLAIGRIYHWNITTHNAKGAENIDNDDEAVDLCDDWSVDNDAIDIFFVLTYAGSTLGLSPVNGPCDKNNSKDMEGCVVTIEGITTKTPYVLAHELGHYLGLKHVDDINRLMYESVPNGAKLTANEGSKIRRHCFVKNGC